MKNLKASESVKTESNGRIISILILGILVISFFSLYIGLNEFRDEEKNNTNTNPINENKLEFVIGTPISSWFNNNEDPIYIDATATGVGAYNWTWARNQDWCSVGDGTQGNPYLIENISIDCLSSGSGIYIKNSNGIYFTINNCSVINSGINTYDAGIRLENTSNGTIEDNFFCHNGYGGIVLYNNVSWNLLSNNTANDNSKYGIRLGNDCDSNTISNNIANDNSEEGIYLYSYCDSNTISNNIANDNSEGGIYLRYYCDSNTISNNIANNNSRGICFYQYCDSNTISNNTANDNSKHGIHLSDPCDSNTISNNTCNNNSLRGIYLYFDCDSNTISNNIANDNSQYGIFLNSYCGSNTISNNIANNNSRGIYLNFNCDSNTISNNTVNYNSYGIFLYSCDSNTIYNNKLSNLVGNAYDKDINNWDNGIIGNFWSNYTGTDLDYDGIGDTPHEVLYGSGIYDNFPQIIYFHQKPLDMQIDIGTLDANLIWEINSYVFKDKSYFIIENGVIKSFGIVNEGISEIMFNLDGLEEGTFSYFLKITGALEFYDIAEVIVTNSNPEITMPVDEIFYEIGSSNNNISWSFTDPSTNGAIYSVYREGIEKLSDIACNPDESINISVDGLTVGEYTYKIVVNDGYGKTTRSLITIIVNNEAPIISVPIVDIQYEIGSLNNNITWSFSDISVSSPIYNLYRNGLPILIDASCNASEQIVVSIDGLEAGVYIYVIELDDGYGNTVTESVTVTVNAQEEKTDYSSYIIAPTIGLSIIGAAIIIRKKPSISTKGFGTE